MVGPALAAILGPDAALVEFAAMVPTKRNIFQTLGLSTHQYSPCAPHTLALNHDPCLAKQASYAGAPEQTSHSDTGHVNRRVGWRRNFLLSH